MSRTLCALSYEFLSRISTSPESAPFAFEVLSTPLLGGSIELEAVLNASKDEYQRTEERMFNIVVTNLFSLCCKTKGGE